MAATVSPWAKPGAWALDSEEHEDELLHQQNDKEATPLADFPSLSAAATTKPKKKKGQTFSLADFTTYAAPKPPSHTNEPIGLTHQDRLVLPTGPRERTAEELERNGLGNGFRSYGLSGYDRGNRNGDDSSNSKWGSRGSDRSGRESNRESAPSRADEIDNWTAAKKPVIGNGFDRKERRGFFDSQSKADESDSWVSNKSYVPSEGRRFSGNGFEREKSFDRERRGFPSNGGGADSDNWGKKREDLDNWPKKREDSDSWGKKKEESIGGIGNEGARPRLNLQPRTLPASNGSSPGSGTAGKPKGSNPFGEARPREEVLAEKGQDWKKIDEQLESLKIKEANEKADGFGKRSFGNGHPSERAERSWRKPEAADTGSQSEEKVENEQVEAEAEES